jgi:hypothetical protein
MTTSANFSAEIELLDQTIREGGRPIAILMGAGCSASLSDGGSDRLVPTIAGLTSHVTASVDGDEADSLKQLVGTFVEDGLTSSTVEDWLSRVRSMQDVAGVSAVRGLTKESLARLEKAITHAIADRVSRDLPVDGGGFDALARWAARWPHDRTEPLRVFSLNYDLLVEQAFERYEVPFFDGFVGSRYPFLDQRSVEGDGLPNYWARVWKMHGSVNWEIHDGRVTRPTQTVATGESLIHPSHLKYEQSRRMPFLLMQDQLKRFLKLPSAALVVCGFSFGDDHVNELVFDGLRANSSAVAFALMHDKLPTYDKAIADASRVSNIRFLAPDGYALAGDTQPWGSGAPDPATGIEPKNVGDFASLGKLLLRQATSL